MRRHGWFLLLAAVPLTLAGCGQQATTVATEEDAAPGPAAAVKEFLEAIRTGNDVVADQMLTSAARQEARDKGMGVAPPGSDTVTFEVGEAEMLPDDRAQVPCQWTDRDEEGGTHTDEVIWVLRKEPEGWRVGGMVAKIFPDLPPYRFNFENLDDMIAQQEAVNAEKERRAAGARAQAKQPPPAEDPIRR